MSVIHDDPKPTGIVAAVKNTITVPVSLILLLLSYVESPTIFAVRAVCERPCYSCWNANYYMHAIPDNQKSGEKLTAARSGVRGGPYSRWAIAGSAKPQAMNAGGRT